MRPTKNIGSILYFGILSVVFAEVFSGSAPLWFLDPWGIFVVLPLYWFHGLLLLNLAMRFRRSSPSQLYLWGILYGLYESWMTKVIWAGYMGEEGPQFGTFLGFAIGEFLVIALFWHAIFSFIIPIFVFEISSVDRTKSKAENDILPAHTKYISNERRNQIIFLFVFLLGATMLVSGLNADLFTVALSASGNLLLIGFTYFLAKSTSSEGLNINQLRLGKRGLGIASLYLTFLYVFMWFVIFPDRIPDAGTILLTIGFYIFVVSLIYLGPKDNSMIEEQEPIGTSFIWSLFGIFTIIALIWCFVPPLVFVIGTLMYLAMVLLGPILFILVLSKFLHGRLKSTNDHSSYPESASP